MDGRAFLDVARELAAGSSEAHWRSSVGRAYYALLHEVLGTLRRWGFSLPPRDKVHTFARLKLVYAKDSDLKRIGLTLEALGRLRNAADYQLSTSGPFVSAGVPPRPWPMPRQRSSCSTPSKPTRCGVRRPWGRFPREHSGARRRRPRTRRCSPWPLVPLRCMTIVPPSSWSSGLKENARPPVLLWAVTRLSRTLEGGPSAIPNDRESPGKRAPPGPSLARDHRECGRAGNSHGFFDGKWHRARPCDRPRPPNPIQQNIGPGIGLSKSGMPRAPSRSRQRWPRGNGTHPVGAVAHTESARSSTVARYTCVIGDESRRRGSAARSASGRSRSSLASRSGIAPDAHVLERRTRPGAAPGGNRPGGFRDLLRRARRGRRPGPEAGAGVEVRGVLLIRLGRRADLQVQSEVTRSVTGKCSLHRTTVMPGRALPIRLHRDESHEDPTALVGHPLPDPRGFPVTLLGTG